MAASTHVIEIVNGIGEPGFIPLTSGKESPTLSIGRRGQWRIDGARMLDVHAYAYFDGYALFLQTTDPDNAACVDGFPIGTEWTEVRPPCSIDIGGARLEYRAEERAAAGPPPAPAAPPKAPTAAPIPAAGQPPAARTAQISGGAPAVPTDAPSRPFQPGAFSSQADDGESTRVAPLDLSMSRSGTRPPTGAFPPAGGGFPMQAPGMPSAGMSGGFPMQGPGASGGFPMQGPGASGGFPMQGQGGMPGGMPGMSGGFPNASMSGGSSGFPPMQPMQAGGSFSAGQEQLFPQGFSASGVGQLPQAAPPAETDPLKKAIADFKTASPVRKLTYIILPLALVAAALILFTDDPPPPPKKAARSDAGAEAGALAGDPAPVPSAMGLVPTPTPPSTPPTPTPTAPGTAPNAPNPTPGPAPSGTSDPSAAAGKDAGKGPTLERTAVDEVHKGDLAKAAEAYEQLAREQPQNPSYAYAARILRERLAAGAAPPGAPASGAPPPPAPPPP
ncbi:MAG: hypothetical protein IPF92_26620 [Myxococcales bacterium]|nr:hypothetical protein [Myxococcales bacterium]MBL0194164.1 hypothetical protein [Myxococcales bacterium]